MKTFLVFTVLVWLFAAAMFGWSMCQAFSEDASLFVACLVLMVYSLLEAANQGLYLRRLQP